MTEIAIESKRGRETEGTYPSLPSAIHVEQVSCLLFLAAYSQSLLTICFFLVPCSLCPFDLSSKFSFCFLLQSLCLSLRSAADRNRFIFAYFEAPNQFRFVAIRFVYAPSVIWLGSLRFALPRFGVCRGKMFALFALSLGGVPLSGQSPCHCQQSINSRQEQYLPYLSGH